MVTRKIYLLCFVKRIVFLGTLNRNVCYGVLDSTQMILLALHQSVKNFYLVPTRQHLCHLGQALLYRE